MIRVAGLWMAAGTPYNTGGIPTSFAYYTFPITNGDSGSLNGSLNPFNGVPVSRQYGGTDAVGAYSMIEVDNQGFVYIADQEFLVKISSSGVWQWTYDFGARILKFVVNNAGFCSLGGLSGRTARINAVGGQLWESLANTEAVVGIDVSTQGNTYTCDNAALIKEFPPDSGTETRRFTLTPMGGVVTMRLNAANEIYASGNDGGSVLEVLKKFDNNGASIWSIRDSVSRLFEIVNDRFIYGLNEANNLIKLQQNGSSAPTQLWSVPSMSTNAVGIAIADNGDCYVASGTADRQVVRAFHSNTGAVIWDSTVGTLAPIAGGDVAADSGRYSVSKGL